MKTTLLKTEQGIALEIDGVVSDCKLDLTAVADQIGELWGIWDVDKLAEEDTPDSQFASALKQLAYKRGFQKCLDLNKEKQFTREDMKKAVVFGFRQNTKNYSIDWIEEKEFISSLRPDRVECTVEMETSAAPYPPIIVGELKTQIPKPKIVNGTIKVRFSALFSADFEKLNV